MDYEKKYKEALERAKNYHDNNFSFGTTELTEAIFPELRESEDEWIRRRMVEHFKSKTKETWCRIPVKDILKWLEKQKVLTDHKEGIYYYHRDGTFTFISPPAVENPHNFTVPKPNEKPVDYDHEMWKNCEANFEGGKKEVIDHPEKYGLQKEQKPNYCHHEVDETGWTEEYRKAYYDGWNNCNMQHEQLKAGHKPAEWSEEDEKMKNDILDLLDSNIAASDYHEIEDWLNAIPNRISLRPSWKPSDEQMTALRDVITMKRTGNEFAETKLREIYEQLQKQ